MPICFMPHGAYVVVYHDERTFNILSTAAVSTLPKAGDTITIGDHAYTVTRTGEAYWSSTIPQVAIYLRGKYCGADQH